VTWKEYEDGLEGRISDLHSRVHRGAYRHNPREESTFRRPTGGSVRMTRGPGRLATPFLYESFIHNSMPVLSRRTQQPAKVCATWTQVCAT
jgi:hypothetical protein